MISICFHFLATSRFKKNLVDVGNLESDEFNSNSYTYPPVPKFGKLWLAVKAIESLSKSILAKFEYINLVPSQLLCTHNVSLAWFYNSTYLAPFHGIFGRDFTVRTFRISQSSLKKHKLTKYAYGASILVWNEFDTQYTVIGVPVNSEIWRCDSFL